MPTTPRSRTRTRPRKNENGPALTYVRDGRPCADPVLPAVWFAFSPDRRGGHPQTHLKSFHGTLQPMPMRVFIHSMKEAVSPKQRAGPMARRKFHDILAATDSPTAAEAVRRIGELYAVELQVRGSPPEIRLARDRPAPGRLWRIFGAGSIGCFKTYPPRATGAIRYALTRWTALTRYFEDGTVEIDNNAAERALRFVALGRNYVQSIIMCSASTNCPWTEPGSLSHCA